MTYTTGIRDAQADEDGAAAQRAFCRQPRQRHGETEAYASNVWRTCTKMAVDAVKSKVAARTRTQP